MEDSTVSGGYKNVASGSASTIGGGKKNTADSIYTTVSGGRENYAKGMYATVGGGAQNKATDWDCTVGGGDYNLAIMHGSTVAGGHGNVSGGYCEDPEVHEDPPFASTGKWATIAGGHFNTASGLGAYIGGGGTEDPLAWYGEGNTASGYFSVISGGYKNEVGTSGSYSVISGGFENEIMGDNCVIPGGFANKATGSNSFVFGNNAIGVTNSAVFNWGGGTGTVYIGCNDLVGTTERLWVEGSARVTENSYVDGKLVVGTVTLPNSSLHLNGSMATAITTTSPGEIDFTVFANADVTLPGPLTCRGRIYVIKNVGGVPIEVNSTGGENIDLDTEYPLAPLESITVQSYGSVWYVIASHLF